MESGLPGRSGGSAGFHLRGIRELLVVGAMLPNEQEFWQVGTPREARARILDALRFGLLGPETPDEVLSDSPLTRYAAGMLAPFGTGVPEEERDEQYTSGEEDEEAGAVDLGPPMSQAITPSSIGISFLVPAATQRLSVCAEWGDYRPEEIEDDDPENVEMDEAESRDLSDDGRERRQRRKRRRLQWIRTPRLHDRWVIELQVDGQLQGSEIVRGDGVTVEHLSRTLGGRLAVSVFLVNRRQAGEKSHPPVDRWIFQPSLAVRSESSEPPFIPRELEPELTRQDRDVESNRLLFRRRREFAVGHGCGAEWTISGASEHALEVRTELVPKYELPGVIPPPAEGRGLEMNTLASARSPDELRDLLTPLVDRYAEWIRQRHSEASSLSANLHRVASTHLGDCASALERMRRGIELLVQDEDAVRAFQFANRAMLLQRSHSVWARQRKEETGSAPPEPRLSGKWRPFQLAFILLNLPSMIDETCEDRFIGDLLWFPTGGGKTEAYLGLAAFTMALRRRRSLPGMRTDAGLSILMRYTLRLLTIQQFQRATTLVCAAEALRSNARDTWGHYRFSIGLWLGRQGTPNTHDESRRTLLRLQKDPSEEGANPCVLESCPWCGETFTPRNYWVDGDTRRTRVGCPRQGCRFHRSNDPFGLPVVVVDEEIYRECPSIVIATVDKFAQMPWNGEVQSLFGIVNRECERCGFLTAAADHVRAHRASGTKGRAATVRETERLAPPELIIQDELHLISGPLGTLVGLYETAVDFLSSRRVGGHVVRPKVVASTATVRRAFDQVQAVFQRDLRVFPPPGLDPNESFFAKEQEVGGDTPGRLYVGVCAPGKSMKTAYVRVVASLLSSARGVSGNPTLAEPYMTVVSYFNSLRELGSVIRLMDDDIPARLDQQTAAGLPRRRRPVYAELTSRIRQEDIPQLLRRLERRHDASRTDDAPLPLDAVLASNMISVGVDIDRLGLMTVSGQPKTTAEYIQATSRVGRQEWGPGLVVTIYNWSRPRDLSHYERFRHYHATLYRSVEAVSATPFSSRALDRGLRGTYVAMNRLTDDDWSPEDAAIHFKPHTTRVANVIDRFRQRAEAVVDQATATAVVEALKGLGDEWWEYRRNPLRYGWRSPDRGRRPPGDVLLRVAEGGRDGHWPAPQSLREIEDVSLVRVLGINDA